MAFCSANTSSSSIGWIVALVCDGDAGYNLNGFGRIHVVQEKQGQTLPLIHFPAHKMNDNSLSAARTGFKKAVRQGAKIDRYRATDAVLQHEHFVAYIRAHFRKGFRKNRSST